MLQRFFALVLYQPSNKVAAALQRVAAPVAQLAVDPLVGAEPPAVATPAKCLGAVGDPASNNPNFLAAINSATILSSRCRIDRSIFPGRSCSMMARQRPSALSLNESAGCSLVPKDIPIARAGLAFSSVRTST